MNRYGMETVARGTPRRPARLTISNVRFSASDVKSAATISRATSARGIKPLPMAVPPSPTTTSCVAASSVRPPGRTSVHALSQGCRLYYSMDELQAIAIDDQRAPDLAVRAIASGSVIAFPTDTVYGLGAGLWRPDAITKLYALKGRPDEKALPVLLAAEEQWTEAATEASEAALRLMRRFWPGALTIVLPRRLDVPDAVGPLTRTIALRVPGHERLRRILARTGPLASSSANRSGHPPATSAKMALNELRYGLALVLDGGALPPRPPSTVVDVTGPELIIVRQGAITADAIARALAARDEYNKP